MTNYETSDGAEFSAADHVDLVNQLRKSSRFDDSPDNATFMVAFAQRAQVWYGRAPRADSEINFVADLTDLGYFKEA